MLRTRQRTEFASSAWAAALLGTLLLTGCAGRPSANGIPNFAEVTAGIYRGGQPSEQGWQYLRSLGVNREVADQPPEGMHVYFLPLPPATIWELFQRPNSNQVSRAVQAMKQGGAYVHCQQGRDRTGLVVGCYRIWIEGWSTSAAAREMSAMGYRWSIPGLTEFWRSVTPEKCHGPSPGGRGT